MKILILVVPNVSRPQLNALWFYDYYYRAKNLKNFHKSSRFKAINISERKKLKSYCHKAKTFSLPK